MDFDLGFVNNFCFGYINVSCFFETFPGVGVWLGGLKILMKTLSSNLDLDFDLGFVDTTFTYEIFAALIKHKLMFTFICVYFIILSIFRKSLMDD